MAAILSRPQCVKILFMFQQGVVNDYFGCGMSFANEITTGYDYNALMNLCPQIFRFLVDKYRTWSILLFTKCNNRYNDDSVEHLSWRPSHIAGVHHAIRQRVQL